MKINGGMQMEKSHDLKKARRKEWKESVHTHRSEAMRLDPIVPSGFSSWIVFL